MVAWADVSHDESFRFVRMHWHSACTCTSMYFRRRKKKVYKGLIAGCVGGLAASWVMTRFQFLLAHALGQSSPHEGQGEDATVKTAQGISSKVLHHDLSPDEKQKAGPLVHYAYGTGIGALYGGLAQKDERLKSGFGTAYGTAVWALGDEVAVPALGLSAKPSETPLSQHAQALAAHLVYGATLEGVRRLVLKAL
jgi:putative membrane protein